MPDRERVIRGLEVCLAADLTKDENPCAPCPYFFDGMCQNTMKKDALVLLKEQEPVKPYDNPLGYYRCGNCGTHVHKYGEQDKYCPGCGRKVKWDD